MSTTLRLAPGAMPPLAAPDLINSATVAAYLALCLIWGSTFLALHIAVETLSPWILICVRSTIAGSILMAIALWRRAAWPGAAALASAAISGVLMFTCSQAMLAWGETRLPSGTAAVLACTVSLFTPIVSWITGASTRPGWMASAGLLVGFAGVAVLVRPHGAQEDMFACAMVLLSSLAWAFGAALARRVPPAESALLGSGLQLLAGGIGAILVAGARGELLHPDLAAISLRSMLATLYLIGMGSLVAFACFGWLVHLWRPERLSTYAYINPLIALILGATLAGETLGGREMVGTALILGAVGLVMMPRRVVA